MNLQRGFYDFGRNDGACAVPRQIVHAILMTRKFLGEKILRHLERQHVVNEENGFDVGT